MLLYKIIHNFIIYYINIIYIKCLLFIINDLLNIKTFNIFNIKMGIGDWGLGIGDWGLGIGPNPQSPIPIVKNIKNLEYYNYFS